MKKVFLILLLPVFLHAAAFDKIGVGAKAQGMSGAYVGLSDDIYGVYYNPAGMVKMQQTEVSVMRDNMHGLGLFNYTFVGYARPGVARGTIGLSWINLSVGPNLKLYNFSENTVALTYGFPLIQNLNAGLSLKFYGASYGRIKGTGWGADLSLMYYIEKMVTIGLICQDVNSPSIKWDTSTAEIMDRNINAGVSGKPLPFITVTADIKNVLTEERKFAAGAEVWLFNDKLKPRIGFQTSGAATVSFGLGVVLSNFQFDYALQSNLDQNWSQIIGVTIKL